MRINDETLANMLADEEAKFSHNASISALLKLDLRDARDEIKRKDIECDKYLSGGLETAKELVATQELVEKLVRECQSRDDETVALRARITELEALLKEKETK